MIDLHGQISFAFLKKSRFTGSYKGMRYLLQKQEREKEAPKEEPPAGEDPGEKQAPVTKTVLEAVIWPEPFNYEVTKADKKHGKDFPFCEDGLWEAVGWLNREFEAGHF
ncbi:hypothetical protein D3Z51_14745 [Clostridiaceae bacterium]|nr:hypothetical protein [Clostridiaceae bacterium]RKI11089.1 hypothetical protein D7V81_14485 [bacterium 1XD21-70]